VRIKSQEDFLAGLMFSAIGIAFALGSMTYRMGTTVRMGPGYFPLILGILLAVLGSIVLIKSVLGEPTEGRSTGRFAWRPLTLILGANVLFGILMGGLPSIGLPSMGLIVAICVMTVVASLASAEFSWRSTAIVAAVLCVGSYLIFILGLKLIIPVWPFFIGW